MKKVEALERLEKKNEDIKFWVDVLKKTDTSDQNHRIFGTVLKNTCSEFNKAYQEVKDYICL